MGLTPEQWIQRVDDPFDTEGGGGGGGVNNNVPQHVSHLGYWSPGVEDSNDYDCEVSNRYSRLHRRNEGTATVGVHPVILDALDESLTGVW